MNKTFEVVYSHPGYKQIKVYENSRRIADIILDDSDVDGACKILNALGYYCLYKA